MMVHEFQAKELLSCYGLVSPGGKVAITGQEAENIARGFSSGSIVVKAQVHAGGRGRAGGVIVVIHRSKRNRQLRRCSVKGS